ncbi:Ubiquitin domain containing protein [Parasponia andersonii]|uniref:Ubiquitin domain containing protein n=1 Tax=Parasponia andersonii TaxID=3476 RepID=A0A2P5BVJ1_PARAD|nr:Ubiquitin domain containing protein [Parasponia andersonii]
MGGVGWTLITNQIGSQETISWYNLSTMLLIFSWRSELPSLFFRPFRLRLRLVIRNSLSVVLLEECDVKSVELNSLRQPLEKEAANAANPYFSSLSEMAMYIRVKRNKTTYFIQCEPTETILDIKQKLHVLIDQPVNDQRLILFSSGQVLEDLKTLADQKVENDTVVALTLRKDDNEFEEVNIVRPDDFYQSRDPEGGNW